VILKSTNNNVAKLYPMILTQRAAAKNGADLLHIKVGRCSTGTLPDDVTVTS